MSEHTPGFYAIQLHRIKRAQDDLRTALINTRNEDALAEYNSNLIDLLGASVRHRLGTDDKIEASHDMALRYLEMPMIKRWLLNLKSHTK